MVRNRQIAGGVAVNDLLLLVVGFLGVQSRVAGKEVEIAVERRTAGLAEGVDHHWALGVVGPVV